MDYHKNRVQKEWSKAKLSAGFIDLCFSFYFVFCTYGVVSWAMERSEAAPGWEAALYAGLAAALSVYWVASGYSLGRIIVVRTSKPLKGGQHDRGPLKFKSAPGIFCAAMIISTILFGFAITKVSFYQLFSFEGISGAKRILVALFTPDLSIIGMTLHAMVETIFIAFMATFVALPIAFLASFFCARNIMKGNKVTETIYNGLRVVFNFTRSVEPLIWAIIFSVWVGIGPFAGMLALMLHSIASLSKLYSEQIEGIDRGPVEAITATGANKIQTVWYGVVPQIILPYLSFTIYRWDINIRMATIIGLVGGGGIGTLLMQYQGLARWNEVGTMILVIAIVVWIMDYLSAKIREAIY